MIKITSFVNCDKHILTAPDMIGVLMSNWCIMILINSMHPYNVHKYTPKKVLKQARTQAMRKSCIPFRISQVS